MCSTPQRTKPTMGLVTQGLFSASPPHHAMPLPLTDTPLPPSRKEAPARTANPDALASDILSPLPATPLCPAPPPPGRAKLPSRLKVSAGLLHPTVIVQSRERSRCGCAFPAVPQAPCAACQWPSPLRSGPLASSLCAWREAPSPAFLDCGFALPFAAAISTPRVCAASL